ncbi:MAG: hypothetical protein DCC71_11075 [Proteobacteria bacterium]|nr:MAG: hypothetical protein DCC71_11075 [Pseudomonadota bacterium]
MKLQMKHWIVPALFVLLALPTVASAQRADRDQNQGRAIGRGHDGSRGPGRPVFTNPTPSRPPRGSVAPVPEPSAALAFAVGLLAARYATRRRS